MKGFFHNRIYSGLARSQYEGIGYTELGLYVRTGIYFLLGFILLVSCKKEAPPEIHYTYLNETLEPYMFKTGTYWVYGNNSTGLLDSVVVTETKHGFFKEPPMSPGTPSNKQIEFFKITMYSFLNANSYTNFLFSGLVTRNGNESPYFGQPILFPEYAVGYHLKGAYFYDVIDTLGINENLFFNVIQMKIVSEEQQELIFEDDTYLYYQDNIGLIKKEVDLGQEQFESWSLVRWHIEL